MENTKLLVTKIQDEIKELTDSINEVVTTFKKMQAPLAESQSKVPEATKQLEKISEQTETATQQVIDRVESISTISEDIVNGIAVLRKALPATYFKNRSKIRDTIGSIETKAQQNLDDAFLILNALQFQDITSQQIHHASVLMEEVEQKLQNLLAVFDGKEGIEKLTSIVKDKVYDPNANYGDMSDTQDHVDSLIASLKDDK
jgi:chemotaxis regulatin CheY-phosphate phosphatase CheZ